MFLATPKALLSDVVHLWDNIAVRTISADTNRADNLQHFQFHSQNMICVEFVFVMRIVLMLLGDLRALCRPLLGILGSQSSRAICATFELAGFRFTDRAMV
jgi:hypothetical protein